MKKLNGKILALALALTLLVCGIVAITASAETSGETPTVAIKMKNVSFTAAPTLAFAVEYTNCEAENLTMTVINAADDADVYTVKSNETVTVSGTTYSVFYLNRGINPKDVAAEYLVQVSVDGTDVKSEVVKYSILQFALEGMLATTDAKEYARYESIVTYAKSIQEWLEPDGKFTGTPADEYFYIKATGAKDVVNGIYSGSKEVTLEYDTTSLGAESITGWKLTTNNGGVKSTTVVPDGATVTISESTEITPAFAPVETFDKGYGSYVTDISNSSLIKVQNGELVMTANNGAQDFFRVNFMNDSASKTYVFQSDIYLDFAYALDSDVGSDDTLYFHFKNASNADIVKLSVTKGDTADSAKIALLNNYGAAEAISDSMPVALVNNTFNLKIETYYLDTYSVLKFYINGALAGIREINSAENLSFIRPTSGTNSEFLAKFDNVSFYKSDKAYKYETPGLYQNFENGESSKVTNEVPSGATVGIQTIKGANGEDTKAYVLNKTANGNDSIHVAYTNKANTTAVYESDVLFDHSSGDAHLVFYLGTAATTSDYAYAINMYYANGVLNVRDRIAGNTHGKTVATNVKDGEWFRLRIEYTEISDTEILAVVYINGEVVYVSDNCYTQTNTHDDCTWPIFGGSGTHITSNNNVWGTVSRITIRTNNTTKGIVAIDNVLAQSIPTPDYDFEDSDYTNRVHAPQN